LVDVFINQGEGKYCDIHHVDSLIVTVWTRDWFQP